MTHAASAATSRVSPARKARSDTPAMMARIPCRRTSLSCCHSQRSSGLDNQDVAARIVSHGIGYRANDPSLSLHPLAPDHDQVGSDLVRVPNDCCCRSARFGLSHHVKSLNLASHLLEHPIRRKLQESVAA